MDQTTPELRAAIDVAKQRIKVDTYYPKAMNNGLKGNAQGFWSGTALGIMTGALAGSLIAAGLAIFAPVTMPAHAIILGLAGIGGTMGGATGARIGAGSAAIAASTAELERRLRADKLEQEILASPEKQRAAIEAYRNDPVVPKTDTVCETYATTRSRSAAFGKIVSWKTMAITVAVCAAVSMLLFGGAFLIGGGLTSGAVTSGLGVLGMTSLKSALLIGAGAGAATGVSFGIAYPPIFASFTKHTAHLLSGDFVAGKKLPHIKTVAEIEAEAAKNRASSEQQPAKPVMIPVKNVAADETPAAQVSDVVVAERVAQPQKQISA